MWHQHTTSSRLPGSFAAPAFQTIPVSGQSRTVALPEARCRLVAQAVDRSVGRVLASLREVGLEDARQDATHHPLLRGRRGLACPS